MDEIKREKLREINRLRLMAVALLIIGIAIVIGGVITYLPTDTRGPKGTIEYYSPSYNTYSYCAVLVPKEEKYHPYKTESIVLWSIGGSLIAIGSAGIYYYTKKHSEILNNMD